MEIDNLRAVLRQQPFKPFTIRLSDGRGLPVIHPEFVAVGSNVVIVVNKDDSWSEIDPFLIVSLDFQPRQTKGKRA